jgi:hypothetical protein
VNKTNGAYNHLQIIALSHKANTVIAGNISCLIHLPKWDEITTGWRELHNEELHDLYRLSNIVRVIKSRSMRWAGHVACEREERCVQGFGKI